MRVGEQGVTFWVGSSRATDGGQERREQEGYLAQKHLCDPRLSGLSCDPRGRKGSKLGLAGFDLPSLYLKRNFRVSPSLFYLGAFLVCHTGFLL